MRTCLFSVKIITIVVTIELFLLTSCHVILLKSSKQNQNLNITSNRLIKYDEIVYSMKQKKSSYVSPTPPSAMLLVEPTNGLNDLQKTIQNILLIEHYSRDNLQQFKMIYECNEKLKNLENEFNTMYLDERQKQQQQQQHQSSQFNAAYYSHNKTLRNLQSATSGSSTARPVSFTIRSLNSMATTSRSMLDNVRKHLVGYLK